MRVRPTFSLGFGLSGLLSAALAYYAYGMGLFSGPAWKAFLAASVIGSVSAFTMIGLEKLLFGRRDRDDADWKPVEIKGGAWGCPRCGSAYTRGVTECSDCFVPLVEASPT